MTSILGWGTLPSLAKITSASASNPSLASSSTQTRSASWAPVQAVVTMARSSRRFGAKMPGVSTKMSCALPASAMPRTSARVVCTLGVTIATLAPVSALVSVDLPALGAPISAMKPQRVAPAGGSCVSAIEPVQADALALQHRSGGSLFGHPLGAAASLGRLALRQAHGDAEFRIVMRPGPLNLAVGGRRQAARLRPFLQHGLRVAQRMGRNPHSLAPQALNQRGRRGVAAVEKHRPDQRLADVGENGGARSPAGVGLRGAKPQRIAETDGARDLGAGLAAHQDDKPPRQLPFIALRKRVKQHLRYDQTEHMVAEKFEPLVAAGAAAAGQRRNVGQRPHQQFGVLEAVSDGLFERAGGGAPPRRLGFPPYRRACCRLLRRNGRVRTLRRLGFIATFARAPHRTIVNRRF